MKTYTVKGYQPFGTNDCSAYTVEILYRGELVKSFNGYSAVDSAMRFVSDNGGRCTVSLERMA